VLGSIREVFYADFSPTFEVEEDYWGGYIVIEVIAKLYWILTNFE
jgi:hypothetical protein